MFSKLRAQLGLDQFTSVNVGAAPSAPEVLELFHAIGIPIGELWGMSETCGVATANVPGQINLDTPNRPANPPPIAAPGADSRPPPGHHPAGVHQSTPDLAWKAASLGRFGGSRINLALIVLDPDYAPAWAARHAIDGRISDDARVIAAVQEGVDAANARLARVEQIKYFKVLAEDWILGAPPRPAQSPRSSTTPPAPAKATLRQHAVLTPKVAPIGHRRPQVRDLPAVGVAERAIGRI